ncbi:MAG: ATP-binding protein [Porticoccaceae bacterium]|nr:ATP-binding protein [Porticoccaceae bacterium]
MIQDNSQQTYSAARQNLFRLSLIRGVALIGQILALVYFTAINPIGLPANAIALVLAIYASVTVATWQRSRMQMPIADNEFFIHLLADILFFSVLLYFSGGASNPFISYYLIPISIAAITVSRQYSILIAVTALGAYSLLLKYYVPITAIAPSSHHGASNGSLHILGMWANFAVSGGIIIYFISRMASALKIQQQALALQRETQLRNEQLLAVGTLAAGTAHELGTPLNTMKLLVDDMVASAPDNQDLSLLNQQIEQCKITLKQLLTTAEQSQSNQLEPQSVRSYFSAILARWQLMRPHLKANINFTDSPDSSAVFEPTIAQSILNLLNNAADASLNVDVHLYWSATAANIEIRDYGTGLDLGEVDRLGQAFVTDKADGLGLGLFLSQATLSRFGGSVSLQNASNSEPGTLTHILLPLVQDAE